VNKSARVYTNDTPRGIQQISVRANIKVPIQISPKYLYFAGFSDTRLTKQVTITSKEEEPLRIEAASFDLEGKLTYDIKEVQAGREFLVIVTTVPEVSGTYLGSLKLKTNYTKKPELTINIRGRIKDPPPSSGQQKS